MQIKQCGRVVAFRRVFSIVHKSRDIRENAHLCRRRRCHCQELYVRFLVFAPDVTVRYDRGDRSTDLINFSLSDSSIIHRPTRRAFQTAGRSVRGSFRSIQRNFERAACRQRNTLRRSPGRTGRIRVWMPRVVFRVGCARNTDIRAHRPKLNSNGIRIATRPR